MNTVLYHISRKELFVKKWFKGGYNAPMSDEDYEKEKKALGVAELVVIIDDKPQFDRATQKLEQTFTADLTVQNEYDGEYHVGWEILPLSQKEIDKRQAGINEMELRKQAENFIDGFDINSIDQLNIPNQLKLLLKSLVVLRK